MGKTKDPAARIRGAQARAMGEALELAAYAELTHRGALLERCRTIVAVRGRGAPRRVRVLGDLIGCDADGRALLVECKHRTNERGITIRPAPSDFEDHQVEALRQWHRRGGQALVAYFDSTRRVQFLPAVEIVGVV